MDKNGKLQRYDRKDYTELVDFPVEIVGRDGVVRRYTFEDSIRLYQRRITFAPIRYRDVDLIRAEANHCRSRIGQLRRSYFHRHGWGTPEGHNHAEQCFGDLAGELAAFLCRVLAVEGRPEIHFDALGPPSDDPVVTQWYVTPSLPHKPMILYFHRFDAEPGGESGQDRARERFFGRLRAFERSGAQAGDAERLVAFHHTVDCGFVLTGRGSDHPVGLEELGEAKPVEVATTPWDEVMEIVRRGDHESALRRCQALVREQPWHRNAYIAGAMLAAFLDEHLTGDDLAQVGCRYFPEDGPLHYYVGLCRFRMGRRADAERALRTALVHAPGHVGARAQLAILLLQAGRSREARAVLREGAHVEPDDKRAHRELQHLHHWLRWRAWMLGAGAMIVLLGLAGSWLPGVDGAAVVVVSSAVALLFGTLGWLAFRRQLEQVVERQRFEEISAGLRRLHRQTRPDPVIS